MRNPEIPQNQVFSSWKEIASYLNKSVRTVQRWELEFRLPVRRPLVRGKGLVQTSREELDRWLLSSWAPRFEEGNGSDHPGNGVIESLGHLSAKDTAVARGLRTMNRKLLSELHSSLEKLTQECESLRTNMRRPAV